MPKSFLIIGTILAGLAVVLGAFGAHGLKKLVGPETVSTYQTGVQYQMYHALALLFLGVLYERSQNSLLNFAGIFFIGGVVLFSGSLYLLASLKAMDKIGTTGIGLITPIGGLLFIIGWILLLISLLKK
ncbi:MAG: DUF423 domain-containing protein [Bacteroidota bacterium]|nr:DUF423 domain-containing protein [Bacteroidota bacterium]